MTSIINNMQTVLIKADFNLITGKGQFSESKTLMNTYLSLAKQFGNTVPHSELTLHKIDIREQIVRLNNLYDAVNKLISFNLQFNNIKTVDDLATISERLLKGIRELNYLISQIKVSYHLPQHKATSETEATKTTDKEFENARQQLRVALESSILAGTLVAFHDEKLRGIGKSTMIAEKANEIGAKVVVGSRSLLKDLEGRGFVNAVYFSNENESRGHIGKYLVDEMVDKSIIKALSNSGQLVGGILYIR